MLGGTYARVGNAVDGVEKLQIYPGWHQRPCDGTSHVIQQAGPLYLDSSHCQERGLNCLLCARTAGLFGRHLGEGDVCRSATPAATPGSEGGEEFSLPPCRVLLHRSPPRRGRLTCRRVSWRPGEGVYDHIGCPGNVVDYQCKFCHEGHQPALACCPRVTLGME